MPDDISIQVSGSIGSLSGPVGLQFDPFERDSPRGIILKRTPREIDTLTGTHEADTFELEQPEFEIPWIDYNWPDNSIN